MANVNHAFGLRAIRRIDGGTVGRFGYDYTIADALAANIGCGNIVARTGTGKNITNAIDGVGGASAVGVFVGVKYRDVQGNIRYANNWVSGTATFNSEGAKAIVIDDPRVVFVVQASADFQATDSGQFAGLVLANPNSLGISGWQLNSADITGTLDNLKILGLFLNGRNAYGTNAIVEVLISFHEYGSGLTRAS